MADFYAKLSSQLRDSTLRWQDITIDSCVDAIIDVQLLESEVKKNPQEFVWCDRTAIDLCVTGEKEICLPESRLFFEARETNRCSIAPNITKNSDDGGIIISPDNCQASIILKPEDTCCFSGRLAVLHYTLNLSHKTTGRIVARASGALYIEPNAAAYAIRGTFSK